MRELFRKIVLAALLTAAVLPLAACGGGDGGGGEGGEATRVVYALPTPPTLEFYPPLVAEELGFFEEEGVRAEQAPSAEEIPMTAFLENGDADLSMADLDEVVIAAREGTEISVVFSPQHSNTEGTVVPADSEIQSFSDLVGKRVGLASEENTTLFAAQADAAGISPDDVETLIVGTSGATVARALDEGEIDAYVGAISDFTALAANGVELRQITPDEVRNFPGNPVGTLPSILESKRDAIVGFLRAWAKGQYVGLVNREAVAAIVRQQIPEEWQNEAVANAALDNAIQLFTPAGDQIGAIRPDVWESGQQLLVKIGELEQTIEISSVLDDSLIEEINDWDREEVEQQAQEWLEQNG